MIGIVESWLENIEITGVEVICSIEMYHHISRFSISVGMVIGEYRGYVVMIAPGETSRFRVSWILTIRICFTSFNAPHLRDISALVPKKNIGLNQHIEMEAFSEVSLCMETGWVLLVKSSQIYRRRPVNQSPIHIRDATEKQHCCTGDLRIVRLETALNMEMVTWQELPTWQIWPESRPWEASKPWKVAHS